MYIKAYFLSQCNTTKFTNENRMKIMILKKTHESEATLRMIKNLVFEFILYFFAEYMGKYLIYVTSAKGATKNKLHIL